MIIVCPSCGKNFNVSDDQIPDKGRLLQCSNCKHEWFYTKNTIPVDDNIDELSKDDFTQESFGILDEEEDKRDEVIVEDKEDKTVELEKPKTSKKQEGKQLNFFKLLLVFIISFVAFILIVDTFIVQISEYVPFAEKYLDNLYQSLIDISLFFQNLIK